MLDHEHDHHYDHEHETRELSDDELALVSGGAGTYTCPCGQQHSPTDRRGSTAGI